MGITYDQDYIDIPNSTDECRQGISGAAHHSYFAQTVARNLNHCVAEKTAPVLLTFYHTSGGWDATHLTEEEMGPRGRSLIWRPHYDGIALMSKVKRSNASGTGTIKLEVWEEDRYQNTAARYVTGSTTTTDHSNWEEKDISIADPFIGPGRVVSIYIKLINIKLLTCCVYVEKYSG